MQIPILIEPIADAGFRARSGEPLPLAAEGSTREEALAKLKQLLAAKLQNGSEVTALCLGPEEHPLREFAGTWAADDPMLAEWQLAVEEYRRKLDEEKGL